jgi:hypothetical protein
MSEKINQIISMLGRTDVRLTAIIVVLYGVWIALPMYGCLPLFAFMLILAYNVAKRHNGLRRLTDGVRREYPDKLSDMQWDLLRRYGLAIYTPEAARPVAAACNWAKLTGYVVCAILIAMQRWVEVIACFSGCMLALHMEKLLAPEIYFGRLAIKKAEYAPIAEGIEKLKGWVRSEEAP